MNKELIEKLKDPKQARPFGLLSDEEQECLRVANKAKAVMLYDHSDGGPTWDQDISWNFNAPHLAYILKPDWQPDPEREYAKVFCDSAGILCVRAPKNGLFQISAVEGIKCFSHWQLAENGLELETIRDVREAVQAGEKVQAYFFKD